MLSENWNTLLAVWTPDTVPMRPGVSHKLRRQLGFAVGAPHYLLGYITSNRSHKTMLSSPNSCPFSCFP